MFGKLVGRSSGVRGLVGKNSAVRRMTANLGARRERVGMNISFRMAQMERSSRMGFFDEFEREGLRHARNNQKFLSAMGTRTGDLPDLDTYLNLSDSARRRVNYDIIHGVGIDDLRYPRKDFG